MWLRVDAVSLLKVSLVFRWSDNLFSLFFKRLSFPCNCKFCFLRLVYFFFHLQLCVEFIDLPLSLCVVFDPPSSWVFFVDSKPIRKDLNLGWRHVGGDLLICILDYCTSNLQNVYCRQTYSQAPKYCVRPNWGADSWSPTAWLKKNIIANYHVYQGHNTVVIKNQFNIKNQ